MRILTVVGARPQFVKAGPVSRALRAAGVEEILVHTGQHFDPMMSGVFFSELAIPTPDHSLDIHGGPHGQMTGRMLEALELVVQQERPELVLVYGDTNSTLAGSLAAAKLNIPLAHVEAGLRSFNRTMPEEINRVVSDHLSQILLCPTRQAVSNLAAEGISEGVRHVGDVMYDATLFALDKARGNTTVLSRLNVSPGAYAVATIHRAENTDDPGRLREVFDFLQKASREQDVVLPVHPRTRRALTEAGVGTDGLITCEPLSYLDMTLLVSQATRVYTDSGGLQKEAYFHRVPCVTLRDETEWVETISHGWNRLWTDPEYSGARDEIADYGDGRAAATIATELTRFLAGHGGAA